MQVLIIEDEERLADALGQIMTEAKYMVDIIHDGKEGLLYGMSDIYDVIVLDVMLPGKNGFEIARALRAQRISTPILMLTARDEIQNKVAGLDSGADDYMTKPFEPEELLARIRALTRRQGDVVLDEVSFLDLQLQLSTGDLRCGSKSLHLGYKEFEILKILMANQKVIISKDTLLTKVWGSDSGAEDNNVEAYISFLRKKLSFLGSRVSISTIRKVGYRLEDSL